MARFDPNRPSIVVHHEYTLLSEDHVGFGIFDQKGREIGYRCRVFAVRAIPKAEGVQWGYTHYADAPLDFFKASTSVTRNGVDYGASIPGVRANDLTEVKTLAAKRQEASRKSYAKKFGGGQ